ncbi:hypothetical protein Trydic_g282 [Trypoxylus dichotomus]
MASKTTESGYTQQTNMNLLWDSKYGLSQNMIMTKVTDINTMIWISFTYLNTVLAFEASFPKRSNLQNLDLASSNSFIVDL